jgi:hypothetical protein
VGHHAALSKARIIAGQLHLLCQSNIGQLLSGALSHVAVSTSKHVKATSAVHCKLWPLVKVAKFTRRQAKSPRAIFATV